MAEGFTKGRVMETKKDVKMLENVKREWEEECLKPALTHKQERRENFLTDLGLSIKPVYTPLDLSEIEFDYKRDLGFPGQHPFSRGIDALMYRSEPWLNQGLLRLWRAREL